MRGALLFSVSSYLPRPTYRLFGELLEGILQVFGFFWAFLNFFQRTFEELILR